MTIMMLNKTRPVTSSSNVTGVCCALCALPEVVLRSCASCPARQTTDPTCEPEPGHDARSPAVTADMRRGHDRGSDPDGF